MTAMTQQHIRGFSTQRYGTPGIPGGPGRLPVYIGRTGIGSVRQAAIPASYMRQYLITGAPVGLPQPSLSGSQTSGVYIRIIHAV